MSRRGRRYGLQNSDYGQHQTYRTSHNYDIVRELIVSAAIL